MLFENGYQMEETTVNRYYNIPELFHEARQQKPYFLCISAPMVRYSKFEFRRLLRQHGVQLCFTPMIVADSFLSSEKARQNEFTTSYDEGPLIVQFAAHNSLEFRKAAELVYPYADGVDLNCGCPQTWAIAKGYGCALLKQSPEVVKDYILQIRNALPTHFSVSAKIRLLCGVESTRKTIDLARQLESCGLTFLTVHGRTITQKTSEPVNVKALRDIKESLRIPLVVNGNVRSWKNACDMYRETNADGIMAARGLLTNPALFSPVLNLKAGISDLTGSSHLECILNWLQIEDEVQDQLQFQCFHHHLTFMWSKHLNRRQRQQFNAFTQKQQIKEFIKENFNFESMKSTSNLKKPQIFYTKCKYPQYLLSPSDTNIHQEKFKVIKDGKGKFFEEFNVSLQNLNRENDTDIQEFELADSFLLNIT